MPDEIKERKPWDQLEGEPNAAYARFLVYRNVGPSRSLLKAYIAQSGIASKSRKKPQVPGSWQDECTKFDWVNRSLAWDIEMMSTVGLQAVLKFYNSFGIVADKVLAKLAEDKVKPKDWRQALDAFSRLGMFVPAETVRQIQDSAERGDLAFGNSKPKDAGDSL